MIVSVKDEVEETQVSPPQKERRLGVLKGKLSIPDDFDEPLDDLKEYMC